MAPKSEYWQYFQKIDNATAKCRLCSRNIKTCGNTTNLKLHVNKKHGSSIQKTHKKVGSKQPKPSTSSASVEITEINTDTESQQSGNSMLSDVSKISIEPTVISSFRNTSEYTTETGTKGVSLSNAILYMICKDSQPFQIVENEGFLNLLKVAAPLYKVPSRFKFKRMLENKFDIAQNYFKNKFQEVDNFSLTTDVWTDTMPCRSFLGVTIHFLNGDKIETATLGVFELSESHTADYISSKLLKTCDEWELDVKKIVAVVTDAGANMVKAVEIAFGKKLHVPCYAHMLNLVAQKAIKETANLPELISHVKKIVTWFKHSVVASDELRKATEIKLIQDVGPTWNSTFYMIERFSQLLPVINNIINCHASAPPMLTAKDIIDLTDVNEILRPIEVATREICAEKYVTCSKVIPLTRMLTLKMLNMKPKQIIGVHLHKNLMTEIKKRLLPTEHVTILAVSTLLDPRFKNIHFQDPLACSNSIKAINDLLSRVEGDSSDVKENEIFYQETSEDKFDLWSDHYKSALEKNSMPTEIQTDMTSEFNFYLKNPLLDLKEDPLEAWNKIIGTTYPKLKKIALTYLSCMATSTASVRLFSKAEYTLCQQRNRLTGKLLSKILFLQSIDKKFWDL